MKKALVASIIGLAAAVSVMAQSRILLDTYNSSLVQPYPLITYGAGSGGTVGSGISGADGFTVGVYWSGTAATFADASGTAIPGAEFTLGTGTGSTATFSSIAPGLFNSIPDFTMPGTINTAYLVIVAYNGADYASSTVRGHSAVFTVAPNVTAFGAGTALGSSEGNMPGFQVFSTTVVPEPSTFALAGLGLAGLLIFRRRK